MEKWVEVEWYVRQQKGRPKFGKIVNNNFQQWPGFRMRDNLEGTLKTGKLAWCQGGRQHTEEAQAHYTPGYSGGQSAPAVWLMVMSIVGGVKKAGSG